VIGCEDRLRNDLLCVGWGVKLYSLTHSPQNIRQGLRLTSLSTAVVYSTHDNLLQTKNPAAEELSYRPVRYETVTISADGVTISKFVYEFLLQRRKT